MLQGTWNFVKRHQRKFIVTAGVAGGLYYTTKLLTQKLYDMQLTSARDRTAKEGIRRRFDQNQRDCLFTIMSLLPELSEQVLREVDVERLIAELRAIQKAPAPESNVWSGEQNKEAETDEKKGSETNGVVVGSEQSQEETEKPVEEAPRRSKVAIWEDIKVQSFSRTLIAIYAESLLALMVHIQLNMVGRSTYLDSVVGKFTGTEDDVALEGKYQSKIALADEQNFLMVSWWFLNRGWRQLMAQIALAVDQSIGQLSLKERVTHRELSALFSDIHAKIRANGLEQTLAGLLLPTENAEIQDYLASNRLDAKQVYTPVFVRLIDQMRDIIESTDFSYVLGSCVDRLTVQLLESLQESFPEPVPLPSVSRPLPPTVEGETAPDLDDVVKEFEEFSPPPESRVVIVQLLPRIAREGHQILNGVPNQYLENVSASREIQALSAAVYTAEDVVF
ncbi:peroxin [Linderina pennispora]|nr:peroxin [Linderina pennispora]